MENSTSIVYCFRTLVSAIICKIMKRILPIAYAGRFGRYIRIISYVGIPDKAEKKDKTKWKRCIKELRSKYRGIRLWYQVQSSRPGEYLPWYCVFINKIGRETDGFLNVAIDVNSRKENYALRKMVSRSIEIITHENRRKWIFILRHFHNIDFTHCEFDNWLNRMDDKTCYTMREYSILYNITDVEKTYCENKMNEMGLSFPFVCFASRDSEYLYSVNPGYDYSYHNYRDSRIESRSLMIDYLQEQGIQAVRVGKNPGYRYSHNGSIDYSYDYYDDWMDVFLPDRAKFSVEDCGGIFNIALLNNPNLVIVNFIPLCDSEANGFPVDTNIIIIFKLYWSYENNRLLTLEEMYKIDKNAAGNYHNYVRLGVEPIANSAEDILEVTREMNERLDGIWEESEQDRIRQQEFRKAQDGLLKKYGYYDRPQLNYKVGARFLEKYWNVLGIN